MALIYDRTQHRPVKIIMKVDLLREIDRILLGQIGGHEDRHELVNEAISQYLIDLRTAGTETTNGAEDGASANELEQPPRDRSALAPAPDVEPIADLARTAIRRPEKQPAILETTHAVARREPLLGLHNADVPSIAALAHLAEATADGPISVKTFYEAATGRARELAAALIPYEREHNVKLSALLPSNFAKPQAAARGYQAFALGHINKQPREDGRLDAWGPLYLWNAAALMRDDDDVKICMTQAGWELLTELEGLTFERPHPPEQGRRFLAYLERHAPEDHWGFRMVLEAARDSVGRIELNARFIGERDWKESVATSVAQGYLARSREWALVAPKLSEGRYQLTTFGREVSNRLAQTGGTQHETHGGASAQEA